MNRGPCPIIDEVLEALRCGRQVFRSGHFGRGGGVTYALRKCGLIRNRYGDWRPGPRTYAEIEAYVARKLAEEQREREESYVAARARANGVRGRQRLRRVASSRIAVAARRAKRRAA